MHLEAARAPRPPKLPRRLFFNLHQDLAARIPGGSSLPLETLHHSNRSGWAREMRCQSGWNWNQPARCVPTSA